MNDEKNIDVLGTANRRDTPFAFPPEPPIFRIKSKDWWVKVVGMLCHNWALLEQSKNAVVTVYFFHDQSPSDRRKAAVNCKNKNYTGTWLARGDRVRIIDSLKFESQSDANDALERNGFMRVTKDNRAANPDLDWDMQPQGRYYYDHPEGKGIYSSGEYWVNESVLIHP